MDLSLRTPVSLEMDSRLFRLVCLEKKEQLESPMRDESDRNQVLRSVLCTAEGRSIELSGKDVEEALLNWLSPRRDEFYVLSFWPLLLLLVCVIFIFSLVVSSGRCFEHER